APARADLVGPPLRRCREAFAVPLGDQRSRLVHLERPLGRGCRRPPAGGDGSRAAASASPAQDRHRSAGAGTADRAAAPGAGVPTGTASSRADRAQHSRRTPGAARSALVTRGKAPPARTV